MMKKKKERKHSPSKLQLRMFFQFASYQYARQKLLFGEQYREIDARFCMDASHECYVCIFFLKFGLRYNIPCLAACVPMCERVCILYLSLVKSIRLSYR